MNNELERMWKEVVKGWCETIPAFARADRGKSQNNSVRTVSDLKRNASKIQGRNTHNLGQFAWLMRDSLLQILGTYFLSGNNPLTFARNMFLRASLPIKQQITTSTCSQDLTIMKNTVCIPPLITDSALRQLAMNYLNDNEIWNYVTTTHQ